METNHGSRTPNRRRRAHARLSSAPSRLSRRGFLHAGAAAGGGLMLSVSLPFANGEVRAAGAETFAPNAFIRIGGDGQIVFIMPYVEMGQGIYTSVSMLIAEELEVGLDQVRLEHAPPNPKLYGNPTLARRPGDRRVDLDTRDMEATTRSGRRRENHARIGGGKALERRSRVLSRPKRQGASCANRGKRQLWRACRRSRADTCPPERRAQATAGLHSDRHARRSVWIRRQRSMERRSLASTFARRA